MSQTRWIGSFAGLRFIMVIFLIFHHFDMYNALNVSGWNSCMNWLREGFLCVNFFFILSGFVVQYGYGDKLLSGNTSDFKFIFYRIAHLWPLHVLMLIVCAYVYANYNSDFISYTIKNKAFIANLFLVQSIVPDNTFAFQYNGAAWAVSTEMFFYLLFIFAVRLDLRRLIALTCLSWAVILLNIAFVKMNFPVPGWYYYINPVTRSAEFLLGMVLCHAFQAGILKPSSKKVATILECCSIIILFIFIAIGATVNIPWYWHWQVFYTIPVAILIYIFSFSDGKISQLLSGNIFQLGGKMSFSIFLCHQVILKMGKDLFFSGNSILSIPQNVFTILFIGCISGIFSIFISYFLYTYFESPINKFLKSMVK